MTPAYAYGHVLGAGATGPAIAVDVGFRPSMHAAFGLHASIAKLDGSFTPEFSMFAQPIAVLPIDLGVAIQTVGDSRFWAGAFAGLHVDRVTKQDSEWQAGIGFGLEAGVDAFRIGRHRFGASLRVAGAPTSASSYGGYAFGVAYRR